MPATRILVVERFISMRSRIGRPRPENVVYDVLQKPVGRPTAKRLASWLKATERTGDSFGASIGGRVSIPVPASVPEDLTKRWVSYGC